MFGFLKKKLGEALEKFTKKVDEEAEVVEEEAPEEEVVDEKPEKKEEKQPPKKEKQKKEKKEYKEKKKKEEKAEKEAVSEEEQKKDVEEEEKTAEEKEEPVEEIDEEKEPEEESPKPEKKESFFSKIFKKKKSEPEEEKEVERQIESEEETEEDEDKEPEKKDDEAAEEPEAEEASEEKEPEVDLETEEKEISVEKTPEEAEEPEAEPPAEEETKLVKELDLDEPKPEKKGFFGKISDSFTKISLSDEKFEELFWDMEIALLENNVSVEVIDKIKNDLRMDLVNNRLSRKHLNEHVLNSLKKSIESLFDVKKIDLFKEISKKKPYIIAMIGINGSGKTTTLAKIISLLQKKKLKVVVGACDTFRAAAIQQLEEHTTKLGVKLIKQDYGADAAAVAYDAIEHAKAKGIDVVLLDTGGRLHTNKNLMDELHKLVRVAKPDLKIFVGESIAGNDLTEQVKLFNSDIGIDAVVLAKADIDEKGGAAISVSYMTGKPILYMGTGQGYDDLEEFDKKKILEKIGL
ncbi:MAG: signal recognition particle-docking protein FtsY [Nanoarchaeota archaeon]|nr:signal recognition particle-docking protein FtsY [Nanoarchaeota archaeon]